MNEQSNLTMRKVFELLEVIGYDVIKESWYDEEGVEGTRIISPDSSKEYTVFGWDDDCDIDDILKEFFKDK